MKRILIVSLLVCFYNMALGQVADSNAIFLASKGRWKCPVIRGWILNTPGNDEPAHPANKAMTLESDSAYLVHAVFDGRVVLVKQYDNVFMAITQYGNYIIGYSNLSKLLVEKGDVIKAGQSIGNMGLDLDNIYSLDMQVYDSEKEIEVESWFKWTGVNAQ